MARVWSSLWAPFRRFGTATKRAITSLPWSSGGPTSSAYSEQRALSLIPVFASVRILASSVASLPVQLYRRNGLNREPVSYIPQLLFKPAVVDDLYQWLQKCVISLALRGNAYGLITQRDDLGFPTMVEWLNPDDVWVDELHPTRPVYYWQGREVPAADIIHIPWIVLPGKVVGLSPMAYFASTIGHGLKATEYGLSWFDNGGTPPATMKNSQKTITPQESEEISNRLSASMRSRKPLVFGSDWDFTALQVSPEESQFVETMRLNASQIAAIYGVPPTKVGGDSGGSMTYANVEQEGIDFVTFTLRPWLVLLEGRLSALMPGREFVKFNVDALLRTSLLDRYTAHGLALAQGWRSRDEIRGLEELPPLPDGQGQTYGPPPTAAPPPSQEA
ncbi:phage portal protein [Streptomyces sp. NPDC005480]|uniref:phage portal protein n=1 Tax=Streptomyces sp. NPDC005480 TaxID=3154880 RepID=UPI0033A7E94A